MAGLNKVILIGNLGSDPESKVLDSGDTVVNLSIATTDSWKNKAEEKVEKTQWHRLVAWRKTGELIAKYCKKGDKICVEGKIEYRDYEDKDGVKKYATDIIVNNVVFLGGGTKDASAAPEATEATTDEAKPKEVLPF